MKNRFVILFSIICLWSGWSQDIQSLTGHYRASKPLQNMGQMRSVLLYFMEATYIVRSDLTLNENATYLYRNCSLIIRGNWESRKDTLFLFAAENRWRMPPDSLKKYGFYEKPPTISNKPMKFHIAEYGLERVFPVKYNEREMKVIEFFVKDSLSP